MIGLAYILFFSVYGYLSVKAVKYAANWAAENGRSPRVWGFLAGFAMYNLVFWDFIPVYATHAYYCAKLGGLTVYKTPEEWKAENPGVAKSLTWSDYSVPEVTANEYIDFLNQRIAYIRKYESLPFDNWIEYRRFVDRKTGKKLAERRDVTLRMRNFFVSGIDSFKSLKVWLSGANECPVRDGNRSRWVHNGKSFSDYFKDFSELGRKINE